MTGLVDALILEALASGACSGEELLRRLNLEEPFRARHPEPLAYGDVAPALLRCLEAATIEARGADGGPLGGLPANVWECRFALAPPGPAPK